MGMFKFSQLVEFFGPHFYNSITIYVFFLLLYSVYELLKSLYSGIRYFLYDDFFKDFTHPEGDILTKRPLPNGWAPIALSEQLKMGAVMKVHVFGRDIVLMRDLEGKVHAMDPYCPHNGAHLGSGEIVQVHGEDCIRCPFHEWSFRTKDGVCVDVPYAKDRKAPKGSSITKWNCAEVNHFIFVWFHNQGENPLWSLESLNDVESGRIVYGGKFEYLINCDVYLITENTSDYSHFGTVHGKPSALDEFLRKLLGLEQNFIDQTLKNFSWKAASKPESHKAVGIYEPRYELFGFCLMRGKMESIHYGPYFLTAQLKFWILGLSLELKLVAGYISIHSNKHRIIFRLYSEKDFLSRLFCRLTLIGLFSNVQNDAHIWQNMVKLQKPIYLKEERTMINCRRWFSQFNDDSIDGSCWNDDV